MQLVVQLVVLSFASLQAQVSCLNKRSSGKWCSAIMIGRSVFLFLAHANLSLSGVGAVQVRNKVSPIKRVVTLLQEMAKKITEEGEQKAAMYENLECYCGTTSQKLGPSWSSSAIMCAFSPLAPRVHPLSLQMKSALCPSALHHLARRPGKARSGLDLFLYLSRKPSFCPILPWFWASSSRYSVNFVTRQVLSKFVDVWHEDFHCFL